jgi:hypothetical protein
MIDDVDDLFARAARLAKFCHTTRQRGPHGRDVYVRRRPWHARLLIPPTNELLDDFGVGVQFLADRAWRAWEITVYDAVGVTGAVLWPDGAIVVPAFEGVTLCDLLADPHVSDAAKYRAATATVRALCDAHRLRVPWPDGATRTFSHGDATARNVIYDAGDDRAQWIDFESLHHADLGDAARHADDLRAWLVSSWECWPRLEPLVKAVRMNYGDDRVIPILAHRLRHDADNLYHLAQGLMPRDARMRAARLLVE